jgi:hypothetical protein
MHRDRSPAANVSRIACTLFWFVAVTLTLAGAAQIVSDAILSK